MAKKGNGEGSIYSIIRNGKKYYRGQVTVGLDKEGKQIRKTVSNHDRSLVVKELNRMMYLHHGGVNLNNDNILFRDFFKSWIFDFKKMKVKSSSFESWEATYRLRIKPSSLGNMRVKDIKISNIQKFYKDLYEKTESPHLLRRTHMHIKACLHYAVGEDLLMKNPADFAVLPLGNHDSIELETETEKNYYGAFSRKDQIKLIDHLNLSDPVEQLIYMAFATGARLGELLGLKWEDWQGDTLYIYKQLRHVSEINEDGSRTWGYKLVNLKTKESKRYIPLPRNAIKVMEKIKSTQAELRLLMGHKYDFKGFIFADEYGDHIEKKRPARRVHALCKELEIPDKNFHSIRHSYATRLSEQGIPPEKIQPLLGHANITTTIEMYIDTQEEEKKETVQVLDGLI